MHVQLGLKYFNYIHGILGTAQNTKVYSVTDFFAYLISSTDYLLTLEELFDTASQSVSRVFLIIFDLFLIVE